jgi:Cu(I)/Ag(I) efflux system membrane protein CusA/SilA
MKPLATPVIGGMISSLIHILIVTPVIFLWLHERQLRKGTLQASPSDPSAEP